MINKIKGIMKTWYVYKIMFNDGKFYIGYRGSLLLPENDFLINYFSSSKEVKKKIKNEDTFVGEIISVYAEKETAYNAEQDLIFKEISNCNLLNKFCYKDRKGYGILTESAKQKISESTKKRWEDPSYRARLVESHKNRWTHELREQQATRMAGKKRPAHSITMTGRKNPSASLLKGKPKPDGHGAKVSAATKGVPKSIEHRKKLSKPKSRICRLTDKKEMSVNHFTRWIISLESENHC